MLNAILSVGYAATLRVCGPFAANVVPREALCRGRLPMRCRRGLLVLTIFLGAAFGACAQPHTLQGTVRLIVPFSAGGSTDAMARVLAAELRRTGALNIVVDNLPGAAGKIGVAACAKANADGRTLCLGMTTTHTLPLVFEAPGETRDHLRNLVPIALVGTQPLVVSVNAQVPARNVPELVRWLRSTGDVAFSTTGVGSISHLVGLSLAHELGVTLTHIPFKGGESASLAAAGGQVPLTITQLGSVLPHITGGRLVPIATTGSSRLPTFREVPTLSETVSPRLLFVSYVGFFAPRGIPESLAAALYENIRVATANPEVRQRFSQLGIDLDVRPGPAFAEFLVREEATYRALSGIQGFRLE